MKQAAKEPFFLTSAIGMALTGFYIENKLINTVHMARYYSPQCDYVNDFSDSIIELTMSDPNIQIRFNEGKQMRLLLKCLISMNLVVCIQIHTWMFLFCAYKFHGQLCLEI